MENNSEVEAGPATAPEVFPHVSEGPEPYPTLIDIALPIAFCWCNIKRSRKAAGKIFAVENHNLQRLMLLL